ncbi:hypothetical protein BDR06DRAFT_871860, partial [Suillus hirtellus]
EVKIYMAYVDQQHLNGADHTVAHTAQGKAMFNRKVLKSYTGEVIFNEGQLVQVYANALDFTMASVHKLQSQWSAPRHVVTKVGNSYTLATLEGFPLSG